MQRAVLFLSPDGSVDDYVSEVKGTMIPGRHTYLDAWLDAGWVFMGGQVDAERAWLTKAPIPSPLTLGFAD